MVHRFLVAAVVVLLGAGVSFGQRTLTAHEVVQAIKFDSDNWETVIKAGGGSIDFGDGIEVVYSKDIFYVSLAIYADPMEGLRSGCNPYDAGVDICDPSERDGSPNRFMHPAQYVYVEMGVCTAPNQRVGSAGVFAGAWQAWNHSGCVGWDNRDSIVAGYRWNYVARMASSASFWGLAGAPSMGTGWGHNEMNQHWQGVVDTVFTAKMPTISQLEDDWGVMISGSYTDGGGGWDEDGDPGPGGGPQDPITSCGILDIPCNLRRLFIPETDWGEEWSSMFAESNKFPFGLRQWFVQEGCSMQGWCVGGEQFLYIPSPGSFQLGPDIEIEIPGFTVFSGSEGQLDELPGPARAISAWWISEPMGGRKILFYSFVLSFYVGVFRRLVA